MEQGDSGALPVNGTGLSSFGSSPQAVSPVPASIPSAAVLREVCVIRDDDLGMHGGYRLELRGEAIGSIERHYPTWERGPKGRTWVTARGTCKRAEYRALKQGEWGRGMGTRTLRDAVGYLFAQAIEARRAETPESGSVHESAVAKPCATPPSIPLSEGSGK